MTMPDWLLNSDDDEAAELAAATQALNGPIGEDGVDAMAAKFLRRLSFAEESLAKINRREKTELELVTTTYGVQRSRVEKFIAETRAVLEALAQRMGFKKESKAKSRRLAFGMLGRKDYAGKFTITDKAKCAHALKERAPEVVRATFTMSLAEVNAINAYLHNAIVNAPDDAPAIPNGIDTAKAKLDVLVAEVEAWSKKNDGELPDGCDQTAARVEWHVEAVSAASIRAATE